MDWALISIIYYFHISSLPTPPLNYKFDTNIGRFCLFLHVTPSHPHSYKSRNALFPPCLFEIVRHMYTNHRLFLIIFTCHPFPRTQCFFQIVTHTCSKFDLNFQCVPELRLNINTNIHTKHREHP